MRQHNFVVYKEVCTPLHNVKNLHNVVLAVLNCLWGECRGLFALSYNLSVALQTMCHMLMIGYRAHPSIASRTRTPTPCFMVVFGMHSRHLPVVCLGNVWYFARLCIRPLHHNCVIILPTLLPTLRMQSRTIVMASHTSSCCRSVPAWTWRMIWTMMRWDLTSGTPRTETFTLHFILDGPTLCVDMYPNILQNSQDVLWVMYDTLITNYNIRGSCHHGDAPSLAQLSALSVQRALGETDKTWAGKYLCRSSSVGFMNPGECHLRQCPSSCPV